MDNEELETRDQIYKAEQLEEAGSLSEAARIWREIVAREPDPISFCRLGSVLMEIDDWPEAERAFFAAIDLNGHLPQPYEGLGLLYLEMGDNKAAQDQFRTSLELEANAARFTLLGVSQMRLNLTEAARESFSRALELNPSYEEAYYNLGLTFRNDDLPRSVQLFAKALELDAEYAVAHRELGWALRKSDEYDKAEAEYHIRRAIELDDVDGWAYIYLGNVMWAELDLSSAEQAFLKAIEVWPGDSTPLWCLAIFYESTDRPREAELFYEMALQSNPDDPEANLRFGLYLRDVGEAAKAKMYLARALILDPENQRIVSALTELDENTPSSDIH